MNQLTWDSVGLDSSKSSTWTRSRQAAVIEVVDMEDSRWMDGQRFGSQEDRHRVRGKARRQSRTIRPVARRLPSTGTPLFSSLSHQSMKGWMQGACAASTIHRGSAVRGGGGRRRRHRRRPGHLGRLLLIFGPTGLYTDYNTHTSPRATRSWKSDIHASPVLYTDTLP